MDRSAFTAFQAGAKYITEGNLRKLADGIAEYGFTAPIFVWESRGKTYIIDGHQRLKALELLAQEGWKIPPLPVATIEAESKQDAARRLLLVTSQFGDFDISGLDKFIEDMKLDASKLTMRLMDTELDPRVLAGAEDLEEFYESEGAKEKKPEKVTCPKCGAKFVP